MNGGTLKYEVFYRNEEATQSVVPAHCGRNFDILSKNYKAFFSF